MKEKTYAGKIKNTAAQYVKALFETEKKKDGQKDRRRRPEMR